MSFTKRELVFYVADKEILVSADNEATAPTISFTEAGWLTYFTLIIKRAPRIAPWGSLYSVRVPRIELGSRPWQGRILPLNHTRKLSTSILYRFFLFWEEWGEVDEQSSANLMLSQVTKYIASRCSQST